GLVLTGGALRRARAMIPILIAALVTVLRLSEQLGWTLEARAFGAPVPRTTLHDLAMRPVDWLLLVLVAGGAGVLLWLSLTAGLGRGLLWPVVSDGSDGRRGGADCSPVANVRTCVRTQCLLSADAEMRREELPDVIEPFAARLAAAQGGTHALIDLDAFAGNIAYVRSQLPEGAEVIAVIKANAYGHGLVPCGRAALAAGASRLAVARIEEALLLRAAGVVAPILVLSPANPALARQAAESGIALAVGSATGLNRLLDALGDDLPPL